MGLISNNLKSNPMFNAGTECSECSGTKAVAGMEDKQSPSQATTYQNGAGTAVEREVDGKKFVIADGALGNLFTKALQVRFDKNDPNAELSNARPTESNMLDAIKSGSPSNESAAQDTFLQVAAMKTDRGVPVTNVSRIRVSKQNVGSAPAVMVSPSFAFSEICQSGMDVDFVFVHKENMANPDMVPVNTNIGHCKDTVKPGDVQGLVANEMHEIESIQVIVNYKKV